MPNATTGPEKHHASLIGERAEECLVKAQHCERAGSLAVALDARLMYADLAQQWRELAKQFELLEERKVASAHR